MVHWSGHPLAGSNLQSRQSGVGGGGPESALREYKFNSFRATSQERNSCQCQVCGHKGQALPAWQDKILRVSAENSYDGSSHPNMSFRNGLCANSPAIQVQTWYDSVFFYYRFDNVVLTLMRRTF